jgi:hypothetical protein
MPYRRGPTSPPTVKPIMLIAVTGPRCAKGDAPAVSARDTDRPANSIPHAKALPSVHLMKLLSFGAIVHSGQSATLAMWASTT